MAGALPFDADAVAYGLFTNLNQSQPRVRDVGVMKNR